MPTKDRRHEIIQAIERLMADHTLDEITLDDVIREAQIGKGTVYRYFRNKDDLFFRAGMSWFDELCDLLTQKVPEDVPFTEQLLSACKHISMFFAKRWRLFRMMQSEEVRAHRRKGTCRKRWIEERERLVAAVARIFRNGMREGKVRDDVPADILAKYLLGMLMTRGRDLAGTPRAARGHELVVELFYEGARRRSARPRHKRGKTRKGSRS